MNGLQLIAEIKATHPALPTLLLTGWGETVLQNNVVEAMPDAVLGKPINQSDLLETLAKLIPPLDSHAVTHTSPPPDPDTPRSKGELETQSLTQETTPCG